MKFPWIAVGVLWGLFAAGAASPESNAGARGPVFVSLDSWIYPALARLGAMGYIRDQAAGMRPWTRQECMRQLADAERFADPSPEAARLIVALREEFAKDAGATPFAAIDSLYTRALAIAGEPLVDGYNFGQTVVNDYGRAVGQGGNYTAGFTAEAGAGRFSFYTRSELEISAPYASPAGALASRDAQLVAVLPEAPNGVRRFHPLELYGGVSLGKWALTAGLQDLWWGPGEAGPLSFGSNAEPFFSFRFSNPSPIALPGFLRRFGSFRIDLIGGELAGHRLPARPLVNGQKVTWNIASGLEVGFTRWSLFDGAGVHGFTAGSVIRNLFANGATFGGAIDPGDRKSGFDFRWRLPGNRVTLYSDFYADDEPSPLTSFKRSAFSPGIYLARLPGLPRWDLRAEAPSTRVAADDQGGIFFYWNNVYHDANTNNGRLLGTWAGRDGRGLLIQTTYWRSPRSRVQFSYRQNRIGPTFLPGGGSQDDAAVQGWLDRGHGLSLSALAQYERYSIPMLGGPKRDFTASVEIHYRPAWRW